jgi:hypothetical protein
MKQRSIPATLDSTVTHTDTILHCPRSLEYYTYGDGKAPGGGASGGQLVPLVGVGHLRACQSSRRHVGE